jgi:murein DD-endopeptidase MepM/ murein hydrolase activator NlpD
MKRLQLAFLALLLLAPGCSSAAASTLPPQVSATQAATLPPVEATLTPSPLPSATLPPAATGTPSLPSPTLPPPVLTPQACPEPTCTYPEAFFLALPIAPPGRTTIDTTYRFGTTQGGTRDPHHGVEFLNPFGTSVLAAAGGTVVFAGDDRRDFQGPYSYFYGNVVILEHEPPPGLGMPLYSLYGHLSELSVQEGERVEAGQAVGKVGMSGVATGSHLHFEVRAGENTYQKSSNPELWLQMGLDSGGSPLGSLAGRILDGYGTYLAVENIVLERIPEAGQFPGLPVYVSTYEEKILIGQPPFYESFAAGSLPAGRYRVSFAKFGYQQFEVEVLPGPLTVVTFVVGN